MDALAEPARLRARARANPYEAIGRSIFVNRSAVKMANLDALCDLLGVGARTGGQRGFFFADLCSGPGGFTEYILWRFATRGVPARGWGITLKGDQDFNLDRMARECRAKEFFVPCYGADGTGNIYKTDNIRNFTQTVEIGTHDEGVDLVTADGGFHVGGDEHHQEEHSKQLVLCQVLTMFLTLRK
ncbi:ribosomal RNA methyltransferase FtsJ domain-containing protein, partial [Blyttiomyces helicus]